MPCILERLDLRFAFVSIRRFEKNGENAIGIEWRVEINQVNAGIGKRLAVSKPIQIVAKKQFVHVVSAGSFSLYLRSVWHFAFTGINKNPAKNKTGTIRTPMAANK